MQLLWSRLFTYLVLRCAVTANPVSANFNVSKRLLVFFDTTIYTFIVIYTTITWDEVKTNIIWDQHFHCCKQLIVRHCLYSYNSCLFCHHSFLNIPIFYYCNLYFYFHYYYYFYYFLFNVGVKRQRIFVSLSSFQKRKQN